MMFENGFPGFDEASADQVVPEAPVEPVVSDVPVESGVPVVSEAPAKAKLIVRRGEACRRRM